MPSPDTDDTSLHTDYTANDWPTHKWKPSKT